MPDRIDELIENITVDAYNPYEQLRSFCQAFKENARFPFHGRIIGVEVIISNVSFDGDERRGLVAACERGGEHHTVSLLEIAPAGPLTLETRELLDAYRRWAGAVPLTPVEPEHARSWTYPHFASIDIDIETPLALNPMGDWDPNTRYWGEPDDLVHPLSRDIFAVGVRSCFEMEQVLPGVEPDDWDSDPIVDAAELHRAGKHLAATRLLEGVLALDVRCIDAWGHLGLVAFDTRGPAPAVALYETGVAIAERSLPDGFRGVLPWGMIDNRPFLRCLHGLALCAWRQRRWDDAEAIFTARAWLDPSSSLDALACLEPVRAHQRWTHT